MAFEVGDYIIGNRKNSYALTAKGVICKVENVFEGGKIDVSVQEIDYDVYTGTNEYGVIKQIEAQQCFAVRPESFDLYEKKAPPKAPRVPRNDSIKFDIEEFAELNGDIVMVIDVRDDIRKVIIIFSEHDFQKSGNKVDVNVKELKEWSYEKDYKRPFAVGDKVVVLYTGNDLLIGEVHSFSDKEEFMFRDINVITKAPGRLGTIKRQCQHHFVKPIPDGINMFWLSNLYSMRNKNIVELYKNMPESSAKQDITNCLEFLKTQ